ncbi:MAG: PaaI family thioesterase [Paracoccaceae bacterium]
MPLAMDIDTLSAFLNQVFPQVRGEFSVEALSDDEIQIRQHVSEKHLRPGGTVSGPTMFGLADVTVYLQVMANIGPEALAVTTNASIDFMRKPKAGRDLIATGRLLKLGKVLAVGEVLIRSEGDDSIVARSSMTYSIPPKR